MYYTYTIITIIKLCIRFFIAEFIYDERREDEWKYLRILIV